MPGLRILVRLDPLLARSLVAAFILLVAVRIVLERPDNPFRPSGDTWAYAAAGERLNAGHDLYALAPDDRRVDLEPPFWTIPLVSPPPVAVLWRPLAALGSPAWVVWWLGGLISCLALAGAILVRGAPSAVLGLTVLSPALTQAAISGNANAYLIPLIFLAWQLRDRAWLVGLILATAAAIKLSPILLLLWLLRARRLSAIWAALLIGVAILLVATLGAGVPSWVEWLAAAPSDAPAPSSLAGLTGLSTALSAIVVSAICGAILLFTRSERLWFAMCVGAAVFASPALYVATFAMLVAALSPLVGSGGATMPTGGSRSRSAASRVMNMYSRSRGVARTE